MEDHIRQSNLIENINDPAFDIQGMLAWEFTEGLTELSIIDICKIQSLLTELQPELFFKEKGHTRSEARMNVRVGGKACPSWWVVDELLYNWVLDMQEHWRTLDPIKMHIRFEKIHPFVDGNGRTGRILLWWHEQKLGREPTMFWVDSKYDEYYPLFDEGRS